ncbi:MAG: DUF2095 family protein [Candidatus Hodarchaeales archaeon]|jgi:hypothetical protein
MKNEEKYDKQKKRPNLGAEEDVKKLLPPEVLSVTQKVSADDMEEKFPHLHSEIKGKAMNIDIDRVESGFTPSDYSEDDESFLDPFKDYTPSVSDYLCRARTEIEAKEIIDYSLKQGHLSKKEADELLDKLEKEGVRAFGPIRTEGHYFRKASEIRNRQVIKKRYSTPNNR